MILEGYDPSSFWAYIGMGICVALIILVAVESIISGFTDMGLIFSAAFVGVIFIIIGMVIDGVSSNSKDFNKDFYATYGVYYKHDLYSEVQYLEGTTIPRYTSEFTGIKDDVISTYVGKVEGKTFSLLEKVPGENDKEKYEIIPPKKKKS